MQQSCKPDALLAQQQQLLLPGAAPFYFRPGDPLGEGFFPHLVGGMRNLKSLLFSPYPAIPPYIVRTLHIHGLRTAADHYNELKRPIMCLDTMEGKKGHRTATPGPGHRAAVGSTRPQGTGQSWEAPSPGHLRAPPSNAGHLRARAARSADLDSESHGRNPISYAV